MAFRFGSGIGPAVDACDRLEANVAALPANVQPLAAQAVVMARALDLTVLAEPVEIIVDGHVQTPRTIESWVRVQVSSRPALPEPEMVEEAPTDPPEGEGDHAVLAPDSAAAAVEGAQPNVDDGLSPEAAASESAAPVPPVPGPKSKRI